MKQYPVYLNGKFHTTEKKFPIINPATRETFAEISAVSRAKVAEALNAAEGAFTSWRKLTGKARGEFLHNIVKILQARAEEVARILTMENGKPISQSRAEVAMSIDHLQWFAEEARRAYGQIVPQQLEGKRHLVIKSPVGVVGAISPWNFPLMLAVRKIAPALAAGCPVILKPARQTPLCTVLFAECAHAAKLPEGVFQLVMGESEMIGKEFLENPICQKITFTGSTEVGKILIRGAADQVKRLSLELGGHAPVLVFDDADFESAIEGVMQAKYRNTGQSCIAANRIFVQRKMYPAFLERFVEKTKSLKVGDGLEPQTEIGPLIDQTALEKAEQHVLDAIRRGAKLLCGGKRVAEENGFFFQPTVLEDVSESSLCMQEETFAPIAATASFETEEEGVARANASPYGLSAYVFTRDLNRAFRMMEQISAGIIGINDGVPTTSQCPFGGVKQSGWGRELGSEGMDAFLETKHVSIGINAE